MDTWQIITGSLLVICGFLLFMTFIYPKYFASKGNGWVKNSIYRGPSMIIDKDIPGIFADIENRLNLPNGEVTLHLRNKNGSFIRKYLESELQPISTSQAIADASPPVFITRSTKYAHSDYERELKELIQQKEDAIKERDQMKAKLSLAEANIHNKVAEQIETAVQMGVQRKPEWKQQG